MKTRARVASVALAILGAGLGLDLQAMDTRIPRIVAVGDVHGSSAAFSRLLRTAELVDEAGAWIGGDAVLVQTGDLTDRGPDVRAVLDQMRALERSAEATGGRVVSLLGNHEVYNLIGYYDYQSTPLSVFSTIAASFSDSESEKTRKKAYRQWASWARNYQACVEPTKEAWMNRNPLGFIEYQEALSSRGEYGRWLRKRKVVANVGDNLFLHGGLSPELSEMGIESVDAINDRAAAELGQFDRDRKWLDDNDVLPSYPTLGELHCAVAYELHRTAGGSDPKASDRWRELKEIQARLPGPETWLLLDPRGPVWFRGYANWTDEEAESSIAAVLEAFGGKRVVVGHTPQPGAIKVRSRGSIFLIDTAMAYPELAGRAVALEIVGDSVSAVSEEGRVLLAGTAPIDSNDRAGESEERELTPAGSNGTDQSAAEEEQNVVPPESDRSLPRMSPSGSNEDLDPERVWISEDGSALPFASDEEVLEFLETARVIDREAIGKGITRAEKLLLEEDGVRAHAAFHDVNNEAKTHREKNRLFRNFRDSYLNNLAAYEVGRLLRLSNIAPTALRRIGRTRGSIQLWVEKTIDETKRRELGGEEAMSVRLRRRIADMWVFDNLINNIDRNQGNMLHDSRGEFWMIDHTRSFNGINRLPNPERVKRCSRDLLTAIRNLDEELTRERLRPYLRSFEINALFGRRQQLLERLDERIAELGEGGVLFSYAELDDTATVYYEEDDIPAAPGDG